MEYLTGIGLENFRVFDDMTYLNFAQLTILTGANNSGKSSVLKALMLVADSFKSREGKIIDFSGKEHNLTEESTKNFNSSKKIIKIKLPFTDYFFLKESIFVELSYETGNPLHFINQDRIFLGDQCLVEVRKIPNTNDEYLFFDFPLFFQNFIPLEDDVKLRAGLEELYKIKDAIMYYSEEFSDPHILHKASVKGSEMFRIRATTKDYFEFFNKNFEIPGVLPDIIGQITELYIKKYQFYNSNLLFTHPEKQKRSYDFKDDDVINKIINKLFQAVDDFKYMMLKDDKNLYSDDLTFTNKWSKEFGLKKIVPRQNKILNRNYIEINDNETIMDYGLGAIQIINILLAIETAKYKTQTIRFFPDHEVNQDVIVLIEKPESNLHPNYQSKLADLLVDAMQKYNIQFIVETHSEYLIRKLQYLTAKKVIKPRDTVIHYFTSPKDTEKGETQVRQIHIKENGSLTQDFGTGFLDEADNLSVNLFMLPDTSNN